ncbi:single-stranded-DNA-specific exonuclease RecJ [Candidatus Desulforudis audaxviator]|uniref:Single-stranded-DNA-specific exonuclease RecJ n=1 Tax=Desulforudis audaxviator (strain MP104C) TaxID=477974 RepID=B1I335_DESAP|nr:single-stranded-DNA-specific exonuclease RecJ [Candidatus Desulforudis audaxviator]ACA59413.1 single-stranded-DNA-specific exonuclease RecJ [Candidatus Desulforudis audaxviator MP104C]AZK59395.1 Single-stranded-DNA-specific exonuclease RecJ [Candidatus Desulforudis audaxviator]
MNDHREWRLKKPEPVLSRMLARECGISELTAQLLVNRGIITVREARIFLDGDLDSLWSPYLLRDMAPTVDRIRGALAAGEKILVYGDYDADGMTAAALMVAALRTLRGRVEYHIPWRADGYGLNPEVLERAAADGVGLVITVDCGVSARREIERAQALGLDVVVTDHHEPQGLLPPVPVVNPRRPDCNYPFKDLAGVGVAFKLAQALLGDELPPPFLGLACLGTVADVMPLRGENRLLVRHGLPQLLDNPGIAALGACQGENPVVRDVAFGIAPLLNAAGRIGRPELGVEILLAGPGEAAALAAQLAALNEERKYLEEKVSAAVLAELSGLPEVPPVVVLAGEDWHPGVIGIVASRLAGRLGRPVALIAVDGDEGRGSIRAGEGWNLVEALESCREVLTRFGGHRCAAGFTLPTAAIPGFREAICRYARHLPVPASGPELEIEALVTLDQLTPEVLREIEALEPWGAQNDPPILAAEDLRVVKHYRVGREGEHLKLVLEQGRTIISGIGFGLAPAHPEIAECRRVHLAFVPVINRWNGRETPEIKVVDWKPGPAGTMTVQSAAGAEAPDYVPPPFLTEALTGGDPREPEGEWRLRTVYDLRHLPFWGPQARRFLNGDRPTLVAVPNPEMIPEVVSKMRMTLPRLLERLEWLTPEMDTAGGGVRERFRSGAASTVVAVPPDGCDLFPARVVTLGLMYHWSQWRALARCGEELVLAFSGYDHVRNRRHLRSLAPNRKCLLTLFRLLRSLDLRVDSDRRALFAAMHTQGHPDFTPVTLDVGLTILEELDLVARRGDGGLEVRKKPGERKHLSQAPTFRRVHRIKRDAWRCHKFFLGATRGELARFFKCDIIPLGDGPHAD